ncbi:MAG: hypothetical protein CVU03_14175, partial [Bacteroidetes bacterium HGW-Bacteroidetes-2]
MKKITLCCFLFIAVCFSWQLQAQTYTGDNLGGPINNTLPPLVSNANMPLMGTIGTEFSIDNVLLNITHTWDGDMTIVLISPNGTNLTLAAGLGGSADNYTNTVFRDGNPSITTGTAPFTGTFSPQGGQLNTVFAGEPVNGNWALRITDCCGGDNGTLNNYQITFTDLINISQCGAGNPQPIDPPTNVSSAATVSQVGVIGTTNGEYVLDNISLNITHTWNSDLNLRLQSPMGTILNLSMGNGGSSQNYTNTVFQDGGANITAATGPFTGTFQPQGGTFASTFAGQSINGNWTLLVTDTFGGIDSGTLLSYCIDFIQVTQVGAVPAIVCPLDIVINNTTGTCGAQVFFNNAVAIDPEDGLIPVAQTAGPGTGSIFPVGDTII